MFLEKVFEFDVVNELEQSVLVSSNNIFNVPTSLDDSLLDLSISDLTKQHVISFDFVDGEGDDDDAGDEDVDDDDGE